MTRHAERQAAYRARKLLADEEGYRTRDREAKGAWRRRNPEKNRAHCKVYRALRAGVLVRPDGCGRCGKPCKPEASHDDYAQPLQVEWLCRPCHARKDAAR